MLAHIEKNEGGLDKFSRGYEKFGFIFESDGIRYREWAPGVSAAFLIGDFSMMEFYGVIFIFCFRFLGSF